MVWQRSSHAEPLPSSWREAVEGLKRDALRGRASLHTVCACLDRTPAGSAVSDLDLLAQDLAFLGQQLHTLLCQYGIPTDTQNTAPAQHGQSSPQQQHPQQPQQQQQCPPALEEAVQACLRFCQAVAASFADLRSPQTPQRTTREHSRWHHSQRQRQHPQQQQQPQPPQRLPAAALSALCSCLRQWADPSLLLLGPHPSSADHVSPDLPLAAVAALGALLPTQLDVITARERAAVLALLLALVQPPLHNTSSSATCSTGGSSGSAAGAVSEAQQHQQQQLLLQEGSELQDAQHWRLACKATVVLTDILSEAARSAGTGAAAATGTSSSKQPSVAAAAAGVRPEEAAGITAGLVDALSTACGVRGSGGSSSRGGSMGGGTSSSGFVHTNSGSGSRTAAGTSAAGGGGSRQQPLEGVQESHYYAALLVALNHAVNSNKQGWQTHAGSITESARKLFTYGTRQQQQQPPLSSQQQQQQQGKAVSGPADAAAAVAAAATATPAAVAPNVQQNPDPPAKKKYVPPHARAAATAATPPQAASTLGQPQQQLQQQQHESSDESEQSASDWSDWSDNEALQGGSNSSSRRASGSSSNTSSRRQQQQQQQLYDPIKAVRVRSALLQLLQVCVQADPKALHPYWAALLPSQAPLQPVPLSPHLVTILLYDPSDKVRVLAAAVLGALLEGPAARSLLAVAEAKTAQPPIRGFITMSVSLGHMLMSLHTGLLAAVAAWQQQQQQLQQQQPPQQQQQGVTAVPAILLSAVLRVLCALVPVTPYERLPAAVISDVVDRTWQLWQQLQPQPCLQGPVTPAAGGGGGGNRTGVPPLVLSAATGAAAAAATAAGVSTGWGSPGSAAGARSSSSSSSSGMLVPTVAVLAQAFSTKQPLQGLARWLQSTSNSSSSSSRGMYLIKHLLSAAATPDCLIRIEALAALRGCCINYPAAVWQLQSISCSCSARAATGSTSTTSSSSRNAASTQDRSISTSSSSSSSSTLTAFDPWKQLLVAVDQSVGAAAVAQPGSARSTPRSSPRASSSTDSHVPAGAAAAGDGSSSTSPEVKAAQHAVRLLGDWLAAEAAAAAGTVPVPPLLPSPSSAGAAAATKLPAAETPGARVAAGSEEPATVLASQWCSVLTLMLSDTTWHHPSPVIRSAAAAVCGAVPATVWLQLPLALRQQLMRAAAETAAAADVTAVRAAACKLLGGCAVLPGVLLGTGQHPQQQHEDSEGVDLLPPPTPPQQQQQRSAVLEQQQQQQRLLLQALARCVSDEAVSVRLSASWALANVCDELRQLLVTDSSNAAESDIPPQQQQQQHEDTQGLLSHATAATATPGAAAAAGGGGGRPMLAAGVLRLLCDAAVAAAGDTEKVRAHGVRAVGALLAAWQPFWGLSNPTTSSSSSIAAGDVGAGSRLNGTPAEGAAGGGAVDHTVPGGTAAAEDNSWDWVPTFLRSAFGALQSCLTARSMKVVWNAACAAAAALQNQQLLKVAWVAEGAAPGLLRLLVVLVRDSSNFKIKTHAAAALAAPGDRATYGEVFSDGLLVVLAALQALQGSSSVQAAVGEVQGAGGAVSAEGQEGGGGDRLDEEGLFPNYRYIPGLQVQLEASLLHLLALLLPSDSNRLQDQLRRNQPLLLSVLSKAAAAAEGPAQQQHALQDAGGQHGASSCMLPAQQQHALQDASGDMAGAQHSASSCRGPAQQEHALQDTGLPADPFGQGAKLSSEDGSSAGNRKQPLPETTRVTSKSSGSIIHSSGADPTAVGGMYPAKKAGSQPAKGVAGGTDASTSNGAVSGDGLGSTVIVTAAGSAADGRVQEVLGCLSRVLGPGVLDAWGRLRAQSESGRHTEQCWSR